MIPPPWSERRIFPSPRRFDAPPPTAPFLSNSRLAFSSHFQGNIFSLFAMASTVPTPPRSPPYPRPPLSSVLPPLILGTATFNTQYVTDPLAMPYVGIVRRAVELGITAFDTSPYYGPSELLLGSALSALANPQPPTPPATEGPDIGHALASNPLPHPLQLPRSAYTLITKAGRISGSEFDYSAPHIRYSVLRSLRRLQTPYLDLVYAHDVEFVSAAEVLCAVRELRRLRDEDGLVRYVGISGYPVDVLCSLAETVLRETGEPLDAVLSYGHFTVQNRTLGAAELLGETPGRPPGAPGTPLTRLKAAGVDIVLNASMLGMGLLTTGGIPPDPLPPPSPTSFETDGGGGDITVETQPRSPLAKWHPSPPALRLACKELAALAAEAGERLEAVAIRWSLGEWAKIGASAGVGVAVPSDCWLATKAGGSVMGVSSVSELEETMAEWEGVLKRLELGAAPGGAADVVDRAQEDERHERITTLVEGKMWPALGDRWLDYSWASPDEGFANQRHEIIRGVVPHDDGVLDGYKDAKKRAKLALMETAAALA